MSNTSWAAVMKDGRSTPPFDRIMVTAAPPEVPPKLVEQLKDKGRMVVPVGDRDQTQILKLIIKSGNTMIEEDKSFVRFVPMVE